MYIPRSPLPYLVSLHSSISPSMMVTKSVGAGNQQAPQAKAPPSPPPRAPVPTSSLHQILPHPNANAPKFAGVLRMERGFERVCLLLFSPPPGPAPGKDETNWESKRFGKHTKHLTLSKKPISQALLRASPLPPPLSRSAIATTEAARVRLLCPAF